MAVIKVACPKCGQKVSGDEAFYGKTVDCPICTSKIAFPENPQGSYSAPSPSPNTPSPAFEAVPPATMNPAPGGAPHQAAAPSPPQESPPVFETVAPQASQGHPGGPPQASGFPEVPQRRDHVETGDDEVPSPLFGIISLVSGILSIVTGCIFLGPVLAPVAIITGHIGMTRARHSPVQPGPGKTVSLVGVILGYVTLFCMIVLLIGMLLFRDRLPIPPPAG